ncbi:ABC transporter permease [Azorhizobium doebereinerae]|uniref:ABC transporter permease n=1 Tax=Azorhizobium doebereinerae TaxID=281091 RepID=UPI00048DD62F|nr:ABC transporter permease subunit [Azorhizobium doebereinerae]
MRRFLPGADTAWGAAGLALLALGWTLVNWRSGPFVLPSLVETGAALLRLIADGSAVRASGATLLHAVGGAALGGGIGLLLGLAGGLWRAVGAALAPSATAILGVPPIAWIVLAFLWFGVGVTALLFTVTIATLPIIFAATLQGMRARDPALVEMARVFRLPRRTRLIRIILPELAVHIAPALSTAFAIAWKVALTAEVLGDGSGIGGGFATARAHLDLPEAMAWIVLVVILLLITDAALLGPLRRWISGQTDVSAPVAAPPCAGASLLREGER